MFPKLKILPLLMVLLFPSLSFAGNYSAVNYIVSLINSKTPAIKIETEIKGKLQGKLTLNLPYKWASADYSQQIQNIRVNDKDYKFTISKNDDHHLLIIHIPKLRDSIKISYEVHQKPGDPADIHETIIRNDLIHSTGYGVFATPGGIKDSDKLQFTIQWKDLPQKWHTLSSYGTEPFLKFTTTAQKLLNAVYVAGNVRMHQLATSNHPVYLSLYGKFDMPDNKLISSLSEIIKTQRAFWNDDDFPYFAVSLIEGDDPFSAGGTLVHNSFAAFLPKGGTNTSIYYILLLMNISIIG